jgi:hypothetical protein
MAGNVKLYKSDEGFAIYTDANDERDFVQAVSAALADKSVGLEEMTAYMPRVVDIVCKLRGYKAPTVIERRVLISGPGVLPEDALLVSADTHGVRLEAA